jgi:protein-S-isoprenylcysteine O-methyltransferase Ste14
VTAEGTFESRRTRPVNPVAIGAYAVLFSVVLPSMLAAWMLRLDRVLALPAHSWPAGGAGLVALGGLLIAGGLAVLWRHGGGLPMSPFPPSRLVTRGVYALVPHPIYVGSALACAGSALLLGSLAGLAIVTPVFAAAMTAFVTGYERDATRARLGAVPRPILRSPRGVAGRVLGHALVAAIAAAAWFLLVPSASPGSLGVWAGCVAVGLGRRTIWSGLCRATEAVANSWHEWTFGPIRFLNHGLYAAAGAAVGVAVAVWLAGPSAAWWLIGFALVAELGAGIWAQVVEGSSLLLRPYGYFGSVVAVVVAGPVAWAAGADPWLLLAAFTIGACVTQAFGRLRCLVQGCCHGKRMSAPWGIHYRHPRSRVLRLSDLGGVPVHPTQLYAILASLATGAILLRLWMLALPLSFVGGTYLVLMGLSRFVEEHYRGEPQTASVGGLRLYQWLAIGFVIVGAGVTAIGGHPAPPPRGLTVSVWPWLAALAVLTYVAYGVDFPRSNRRFSRLV